MLYKKAINNNTKGRKRYKQSAERKNKVPFVLSLGSCFGESLKSACLMCLNKSSFMRGKRGKKAPSFFLNFFSQLNFFSRLQKNVRILLTTREIYKRVHITRITTTTCYRLLARKRRYIHTHSDIISKCRNHSRTAPRKTQTGTITSRNSESNPRNGCNDCWTDPSRSPFTDGSRGFFSRSCTRYERISSTGITS